MKYFRGSGLSSIFKAYKLSKSFDLSSEGKFEEAYNNLLNVTVPRDAKKGYVNFFILKGYLAYSICKFESALECFDLFFSEIELKKKYNSTEKLYLKAYVSIIYLRMYKSANGCIYTERQLHSFCNYQVIDLDRVSARLKRNFPLRMHPCWTAAR